MKDNYYGYIYKTINILNNKIYIGKCSRKIEKYDKTKKYLGSGKILNNSINKYGRKYFKKEILEKAYSKQELNELEIYYIWEFDSTNLNIGYNLTKGGDGGDTFTNNPNKEKILLKVKKWRDENYIPFKNCKHSEITKNKMRKNHANVSGDKNPMYGNGYKLKGEKNGRAKTVIFYSPCGIKYIVKGELRKFCKEQSINSKNKKYWTFYEYKI
jgi:group I intron endonuclease